MSLDSLWFAVKSAFRSVFKNAILSIASITVLTVCLLALGSTLLVVGNVNEFISAIGDKNQIVIYFDGATVDYIDGLRKEKSDLDDELEKLDKDSDSARITEINNRMTEIDKVVTSYDDAASKITALNNEKATLLEERDSGDTTSGRKTEIETRINQINDEKNNIDVFNVANRQKKDRIEVQLQKIKNIEGIIYETPQQALAKYEEMMGSTDLTKYLESDTFRPSFNFRIIDLTKYDQTIYELNKIDEIGYFNSSGQAGERAIRSSKDTIDRVVKISDVLSFLSVWVIALFMIVSIFIIMNAVKLSVFSRRTEISIMKYVGATDFYIQLPYFIEGMIIGLFAGLIGFVLQILVYNAVLYPILADLGLFTPLSMSSFGYIFWVFIAAGMFVGMIGSVGPVKKYLKV
ncbi:MAG: hypothetical protein DBX47_07410 [Clostridiales bacterium]|nr:MAG: hypothetical protein DBX47_07410 [Clostridiales bacterium]